jgi:hypothetical protein
MKTTKFFLKKKTLMMGCAKIMFANIIKRSIFNLFSLKNITKEVTKKSC